VIGPHLAITTKHVIEQHLRGYRVREGENISPFAMQAIMCMRDNKTGVSIGIARIALCERTDIAVLKLASISSSLTSAGKRPQVIARSTEPAGRQVTASARARRNRAGIVTPFADRRLAGKFSISTSEQRCEGFALPRF
jgi:hypothetical protein